MRCATMAETQEINPSASTGIPNTAPPMNTPASPAISKPPTLARTSMGSFLSGLLSSIARSMAPIFFLRPSLLSPAPRPVTSAGSLSSRTEVMAALVVVLPIPISPVARRVYPSSASSRTILIPTSIALMASSRLIAGPTAILSVPLRITL